MTWLKSITQAQRAWTGGIGSGGTPPAPPPSRKLKLNNAAPWLGNAAQEDARLNYCIAKGFNGIQLYGLYGVFGDPTLEGYLASFIQKAYTLFNLSTVGCIMGSGITGFQLALTYNGSVAANQRFNDFNKENEFWNGYMVQWQVLTAAAGSTYTITIDGTPFSYVRGGGDTNDDVAAALAALIDADPDLAGTSTNEFVYARNTADLLAYTYSETANLDPSLINEDYASWIASLQWLAPQLSATELISAYVANPGNRWGVAEAEDMIQVIDFYEGTNYTTAPDEGQTGFRDYQLLYLGQACVNLGLTQTFQTLFSAEPVFMGPYLNANGIAVAESTWDTQYGLDTFTGKDQLVHNGFNYFDYNDMIIYVP